MDQEETRDTTKTPFYDSNHNNKDFRKGLIVYTELVVISDTRSTTPVSIKIRSAKFKKSESCIYTFTLDKHTTPLHLKGHHIIGYDARFNNCPAML